MKGWVILILLLCVTLVSPGELDCEIKSDQTRLPYDVSDHVLDYLSYGEGRDRETMKVLVCTCKNEENNPRTVIMSSVFMLFLMSLSDNYLYLFSTLKTPM